MGQMVTYRCSYNHTSCTVWTVQINSTLTWTGGVCFCSEGIGRLCKGVDETWLIRDWSGIWDVDLSSEIGLWLTDWWRKMRGSWFTDRWWKVRGGWFTDWWRKVRGVGSLTDDESERQLVHWLMTESETQRMVTVINGKWVSKMLENDS